MRDEATVSIAGAVSLAERDAIIEATRSREALPSSAAAGVIPERSAARELLAEPEPATPLSSISAADSAPLDQEEAPADEPAADVVAVAADEPEPEVTAVVEIAAAATELTNEE